MCKARLRVLKRSQAFEARLSVLKCSQAVQAPRMISTSQCSWCRRIVHSMGLSCGSLSSVPSFSVSAPFEMCMARLSVLERSQALQAKCSWCRSRSRTACKAVRTLLPPCTHVRVLRQCRGDVMFRGRFPRLDAQGFEFWSTFECHCHGDHPSVFVLGKCVAVHLTLAS